MDQTAKTRSNGNSDSQRHGCLRRLGYSFDGVFEGHAPARAISCAPDANSREFQASIDWRLASTAVCDEEGLGAPRLTAHGTTTVRDDGLAHFSGTFEIGVESPEESVAVVCRGHLDLIGRIGSHAFLGEACDRDDHVEGWLVGTSTDESAPTTWHAIVAGSGRLELGTHTFASPAENRIVGVVSASYE